MDKQKNKPDTERQILEAARKVFIRKGLDGARMQEIADEA
ncbi:MAG TPA: TetR/AcrR family transcriptional regulator, partial [Bacteroidetes bacterium]|nr:TetR/AcrR family transcriptional regulator [Bacteroidota bacterium]